MSLAAQFKATLLELRDQNKDPMNLCRAIKKNKKGKDQIILEAVLFCSLLEAYLQPYTIEVSEATATDSQVHVILTWNATVDTHIGYSISLARDPYIHQIYPDNAASPFLWTPGSRPVEKLFDFILLGLTGNCQVMKDSIKKLTGGNTEDPDNPLACVTTTLYRVPLDVDNPLACISSTLYRVIPEMLFSTWYVSSNDISNAMGSLFRSSLELAMQMHQLASLQDSLIDLYAPCSYTQGVSILRMTFVNHSGSPVLGAICKEYFPCLAFIVGLLSNVACPFSLSLDKEGVSLLEAAKPFKKTLCWATRDIQAYRVEYALRLIEELKKHLEPKENMEYWVAYTKSVILSGLTDPTSPLGAMLSYATSLLHTRTTTITTGQGYVFNF